MREIKFRAWDKANKMFIPVCINTLGKGCILGMMGLEVIMDNVQQYTGLKDKQGKDIYEGDIIKHGDNAYTPFENSISEVYWFEDNFSYYFKKKHIKKDENDKQVLDLESLGNISGGYNDKFEVIGNIFEDKNLIN